MRQPGRSHSKGFGLIILVFLMAISAILVSATSLYYRNAGRQMQYQIDKVKAYYMAQTTVMYALHQYLISGTNDTNRTYYPWTINIDNQTAKAGFAQANYALVSFTNAGWVVGGGTSRFQGFEISSVLNTANGSIGAPNPTAYEASADLTNPVAALTPGTIQLFQTSPGHWGGANTFVQFNGTIAVNTPVIMYFQFTYGDNSATLDSITHKILGWNGLIASPVTPSTARPAQHTFCITSTGQVNETGSGGVKALSTVKATVSANPTSGGVEIMDWEKIDKNIP